MFSASFGSYYITTRIIL